MDKVEKKNCCSTAPDFWCDAKPNNYEECLFFVASSEAGYEDLCHYRVNVKNTRRDCAWYMCSNKEAIASRLISLAKFMQTGE